MWLNGRINPILFIQTPTLVLLQGTEVSFLALIPVNFTIDSGNQIAFVHYQMTDQCEIAN